jgi:hypothetical protein
MHIALIERGQECLTPISGLYIYIIVIFVTIRLILLLFNKSGNFLGDLLFLMHLNPSNGNCLINVQSFTLCPFLLECRRFVGLFYCR